MSTDVGTPELRRRKMHSLRVLLRLTTDDLHELGEIILHRDVPTLKTLTDDEVKLMLAALEGAEKIIWLLATRRES